MKVAFNSPRRFVGLAALAGMLAATTPARALDPFEIQVYESEINRPWQPGLELHLNYTPRGARVPEYAGHVPADRLVHMTLEPALGLTEWLELGAYVQAMTGPSGTDFAGFKLRAKVVAPERWRLPIMLGINTEIGRVPRAVEQEGWANEFRPILGWTNGHVLALVNPIFGYALSGPDALRFHFEPAGKLAWNTQRGFMVGGEYYAGLGNLADGLSPLREQEHLAFLTFDLAAPAGSNDRADPWELNVGLGRSLTDATPSQWIVKTIVGKPF